MLWRRVVFAIGHFHLGRGVETEAPSLLDGMFSQRSTAAAAATAAAVAKLCAYSVMKTASGLVRQRRR